MATADAKCVDPLLRAKARRIGEQLAELYPRPAPPLQHETPFQLLVAVILSAQVEALLSPAEAFSYSLCPENCRRI